MKTELLILTHYNKRCVLSFLQWDELLQRLISASVLFLWWRPLYKWICLDSKPGPTGLSFSRPFKSFHYKDAEIKANIMQPVFLYHRCVSFWSWEAILLTNWIPYFVSPDIQISTLVSNLVKSLVLYLVMLMEKHMGPCIMMTYLFSQRQTRKLNASGCFGLSIIFSLLFLNSSMYI